MENRFLGLIEKSVKTHWGLPAFSDIDGKTYSYAEVAWKIEEIHLLLEKAGIRPEDKIAIVGGNSSNWAISLFGILAYGAVAVPILHEFQADNIQHIIRHSEAKGLFVSASVWERLEEAEIPEIQLVVRLDDGALLLAQSQEVWSIAPRLSDLVAQKYPDFSPKDVHFYIEEPENLAILNYTSGTTSSSKGVMLPYRSLWSNTQFAEDHLPFIHAGDDIVCLLPMAHMYGLAFEVLNSVNKGCHVHFLTSRPTPQSGQAAFERYRPRLILAVPLILERAVKNKIFPHFLKPFVRLLLWVPGVRQLIFRQAEAGLTRGFGGNFEEIIIGGAALNKDVERFLRRIGFRFTVGYGMTECGPLVAFAHWNEAKPGAVGRVVDRMEIKIDSNDPQHVVGEILVRGDNNMLGYYKNPEATAEVMLPGGWMRTGDLGTLDADGFLYIRGRNKTMILGPNGQNIYPEEIENKLNNFPLVIESVVVSDAKKLTALIFPDWEHIHAEHLTRSQVEEVMGQYLKAVNRMVPRYCKISAFQLREEPFEKTPKRSIKRYLYQPKLA